MNTLLAIPVQKSNIIKQYFDDNTETEFYIDTVELETEEPIEGCSFYEANSIVAFHLYIVSDEEIQDNDLVVHHSITGFEINTYENVKFSLTGMNSKKIIYTTDRTLNLPLIFNIEESLKLINKNVNVFSEIKCTGNNCRFNATCNTCKEYKNVNIVIPQIN